MRLLMPLLALPIAVTAISACVSSTESEPQKPKLVKHRPPFKPAPLETLPDRGALKAQKLARPVNKLTKLCPPQKKGRDTGTACMCMPVGSPTQQDGWTADSETCTAVAEGIEAPFLNVQFLAAQKTSRTKNREEPLALDVQFQLLLQTKKGWSTFEIGSTTMEPALGYPRSLTLVSRTFMELSEAEEAEDGKDGKDGKDAKGKAKAKLESKAVLAVFNDERTTYLDGGDKEQESQGWLLVCAANSAQKLSCAEPLALGGAKKKGYQLEPVVDGGNLYLTETGPKTPADLKKLVGKYRVELP